MDKTIKTASAVNLIWKHKHADFKAKIDDEKCMMYPAPHFRLGRIVDLPDELFAEEFRWAMKKEVEQKACETLEPIMKKHGILEHFQSTMQWRDSIVEVLEFASFRLKGEAYEALKHDVVNAGIDFPAKAGGQ